jgi:hypothetical protein
MDNNEILNNEELNNNDKNNNEQDIEFTIIDNNSTSPPKNENDEENYMTNGPDAFQIEFNSSIKDSKHNNCDNNNIDSNTFTLVNNLQNKKEENKSLKDSLEDSNDNNFKATDNLIKSQKSLSNSEENELTEVEEFDQNIILLQNESKTMSSHFEKLKKNKEGQEENINSNKDNILIEDKDIFNNNENNKLNSSEDNMGNYSKTIDIEKMDSLNNNNSLSSNNNNNLSDNKDNSNNIYNTQDNKCNYKENIFRSKGKIKDSLNKYNDYPTLRNIKDNNSLKAKIYNNNYTNNNRYNNKNHNLEEKDNNECLNLLKLKTSDLKLNNQDEKIIMKPLKESSDNSNNSNNCNNSNIKPSISACNKIKKNFQNIKLSSHKKFNSNINTNNNNNKNNISGIPIRPRQGTKNSNANNLDINNNINNVILKNNNINNYLITPRCIKKKRQLNNYAEYYKLKMSMVKDDYNNFTNNNNYINNNNENNSYKNYKCLGHKKSTEIKNK